MVEETIELPENATDVTVEQHDNEVAVTYDTLPEVVIVLEGYQGYEKYIDPTSDFEIIENGGPTNPYELVSDQHERLGGSHESTLNSYGGGDEYEHGWYFAEIRVEPVSELDL